MNERQRRKKPAILPVLLLVVAWCCANGTQTLSFTVIHWAKGARHFSHQQQLKAEVVFLLAGVQNKNAALVTARTPLPAQPATPSPGETATKRIDMADCGDPAAWLIWSESESYAAVECRPLPNERAEPMQPPPRGGTQA